MLLLTRTLEGKTISLDIEKNMSIKEVSELIKAHLDKTMADQTLILIMSGKKLNDDDLFIVEHGGESKESLPYILLSNSRTFDNGKNTHHIDHTLSLITKPPGYIYGNNSLFGGEAPDTRRNDDSDDEVRKSPSA